jgi:hypothetical protein
MTQKHLLLLSLQLHLCRLLDQLVPLVQHFQMHPLHLFLQLPH